MTEAASVRDRTDRRIDTFGAIGVTLGILGVGFVIFGYSPALLASLYVGMAAPYVAIPYTAIAVIAREFNARNRRGLTEDDPDYRGDAARFEMFRQRASMVTAIVMLAALVVWPLVVSPLDAASGPEIGPLPGPSLLTFGAFAVVAGGVSIVVNAPSIYSGSVVRSERYAIRKRVGAWKLILANTIFTTLSWIAYCGFGVYFLTEVM